MSHSFQASGTNISTPHTSIRKMVRRKIARLEWVPRVALVGAPVQLRPCSYFLLVLMEIPSFLWCHASVLSPPGRFHSDSEHKQTRFSALGLFSSLRSKLPSPA